MKRFIALFLLSLLAVLHASCAFCAESVEINAQNFPDETFRAYVSEKFDKSQDGILSEEEIANVTNIDVSLKNISSLKGVEYFTALTKLYCVTNKLTELDISQNTALTTLDCSHNKLTELDVSKSTALTTLDCSDNQLKALDVSKNTKLELIWCYSNDLTALDVSNNAVLRALGCGNNKLTALDVSNNAALRTLDCSENNITELDIHKCPQLKLNNLTADSNVRIIHATQDGLP